MTRRPFSFFFFFLTWRVNSERPRLCVISWGQNARELEESTSGIPVFLVIPVVVCRFASSPSMVEWQKRQVTRDLGGTNEQLSSEGVRSGRALLNRQQLPVGLLFPALDNLVPYSIPPALQIPSGRSKSLAECIYLLFSFSPENIHKRCFSFHVLHLCALGGGRLQQSPAENRTIYGVISLLFLFGLVQANEVKNKDFGTWLYNPVCQRGI